MEVEEKEEQKSSTYRWISNFVSKIIDKIVPYVSLYWTQISFFFHLLYYFSGELSIVLGFIFIFYGVNFVYVFAAFEGFRLYGYQQIRACVIELYEAMARAWEVLKKDDDISNETFFDPSQISKDITKKVSNQAQEYLKVELDSQGINEDITKKTSEFISETGDNMANLSSNVADLLSQQLNSRMSHGTRTKLLSATARIKRVLKVVNPEQISTSVAGLVSGVLGVIATLKVPLAQAITLGSSLGDTIFGQVHYYINLYIVPRVPHDFQRWMSPITKFSFKIVGVIIAYLATRWILAVTVCTRGGDLIFQGILQSAEKYKLEFSEERMTLFKKIVLIFSALGFTKQLLLGYELPSLLWFLLSPGLVIDWALYTFIIASE